MSNTRKVGEIVKVYCDVAEETYTAIITGIKVEGSKPVYDVRLPNEGNVETFVTEADIK